jgi:hypothetical protein
VTPEHRCEKEAARNHRILHRTKARELGMSPGAISRRLASGRWRVALPNVYLTGGGPLDWKARLASACAWAGPDAVVSHTAAAELLGLLTTRKAVCVTVPRKKNSAHGVEVHWDPAGAGRTVTIDGIRATCIEHTLVDLCRTAKRPLALSIVERAIRQDRTDLGRLTRFVKQNGAAPSKRSDGYSRNVSLWG